MSISVLFICFVVGFISGALFVTIAKNENPWS
jgi:hypothetical protein